MKQSKRIAINTLSSWISLFLNAGVMIFLTKFLLNRLGSERFGIFRYILTLQVSLMFLDLGLGATLNRFTSQLLATKDRQRLNIVASFGLLIFVVMGILSGLIVSLMGFFLPVLIPGASAESYSSGFVLMLYMGGVLALRFWSYTAKGLLYGSQRYDIVNLLQVGEAVLRALFITVLFLIIPSSGLVTIGMCYLVSGFLLLLSTWLFAKREIPTLKINLLMVDKSTAKEVMNFSSFVLVMSVTTMLIWNVPVFLAGRFYGPEAVAFISLPLLLLDQVQRVAGGFGFSLIPVAGKYGALGEAEKLRELTVKGTKYCAALCFPLGVLAVVFGHPIFEWFKEGFGWTWALLGILMVPYLMRMTQRPALAVLMGAKSIRQLALWQIAVVGVIAVLSWLFAKHFEMGLYGIVLGAAIPVLFFSSIFQTRYVCRQVGLKWLSHMGQSYVRVALGTIPLVLLGLILLRFAYPTTLLAIVFEGLLCMCIFVPFAWWFILLPHDRKPVLALFRRRIVFGKSPQ